MRLNPQNFAYALGHPMRALRYLRYRDNIPYSEIARYLPEHPVILEAGVANGVNTGEMARFWPQARIHGFEPVPAAMELARRSTSEFGERVRLYPYALGNAAGTMTMNVSGSGDAAETQSSSLLKPTGHLEAYDFVEFKEKIEVEIVTLDEWASQNGISGIDFLWLDLQGYELIALSGAETLLGGAKALHLEVSHCPMFEGGVLYPELKAWLGRRGFKPVIDATFRLGGNVLFVRR
jgi:FkbM family methyltransferase